MDTANLPRDYPSHTDLRRKVPGYFSDESDGATILEFVALRAKSYSYIIDRPVDNVRIKAKGIRGHVVKHHMSFEDHKKCLFATEVDEDGDEFDPYRENISIRSFGHKIVTIKTHKLSYNRRDDKRVVLNCQIHTRAHRPLS